MNNINKENENIRINNIQGNNINIIGNNNESINYIPEFNSQMSLGLGNQTESEIIRNASINTLSIIENKYFKKNSNDTNDRNSNTLQNNINNINNPNNEFFENYFSNNQIQPNLMEMRNPFHIQQNGESNIRLTENNLTMNRNNTLNKKNYIYHINGNLYSYFSQNPNNEDNIIISDLKINNNINNNYERMDSPLFIQNNQN